MEMAEVVTLSLEWPEIVAEEMALVLGVMEVVVSTLPLPLYYLVHLQHLADLGRSHAHLTLLQMIVVAVEGVRLPFLFQASSQKVGFVLEYGCAQPSFCVPYPVS